MSKPRRAADLDELLANSPVDPLPEEIGVAVVPDVFLDDVPTPAQDAVIGILRVHGDAGVSSPL